MSAPRICPHCGAANDARATFCGACATQIATTSTALVRVPPRAALPALSPRDRAALGGVTVGVVAMALRVGAALLRQASRKAPPAPLAPAPPPAAPTLRVRRRWVTGDAHGPQRWGEEEIEIDEPPGQPRNYRIRFDR